MNTGGNSYMTFLDSYQYCRFCQESYATEISYNQYCVERCTCARHGPHLGNFCCCYIQQICLILHVYFEIEGL